MEKLNLEPKENQESTTANSSEKSVNQEKVKVFLGKTEDGAEVYDRNDSHFHGEGGLTPELLSKALGTINTDERDFLKETVTFDHPVGEQTCVKVGPEDDIVKVYRKGRSGQTPMVKNREAVPCNSVIVILKKDNSIHEKNAYELITSFIGEESVREPWDPNLQTEEERQQSQDFWNSHALVYNDGLIDWGRTKGFEFMSEAAKKAELIRQKTVYAGLFLDPDDLFQKTQPTLEKAIAHPHITTSFKPTVEQLNLDQIGSKAKIEAVGYGNDGKNEGLLVKIEADDPEVQKACDALETPHITLSLGKGGQAKNTAFLDFKPLEDPIELTGTYGLFSQGSVIKEKTELE